MKKALADFVFTIELLADQQGFLQSLFHGNGEPEFDAVGDKIDGKEK